MKNVNIKNKNTGLVHGPYHFIETIEDLQYYAENILQVKVVSAFEFLLKESIKDNVPIERLNHLTTSKRNDYGEQIGLIAWQQIHGESLLVTGGRYVERKLE